MAAPGDGRPAVPGVAGARTALAWQRSLLLLVVTAVALVKLGADGGQPVVGAAAGGLLALAAGGLHLRTARGQVVAPDWGARRRGALRALTAVAMLGAALSLLTIGVVG